MTTQQLAFEQSKPTLIFLGMNAKTASAVIAARPELKALKSATDGQAPKIRKLGNGGDPKVKPLVNGEADGAIVIGFNIPSNIAAKANRVIEIPIGQEFPRKELGNEIPDNQYEALAKALASMVRIPLKAYITQTATLTQGLDMPAPEGEEQSVEEEDEVEF